MATSAHRCPRASDCPSRCAGLSETSGILNVNKAAGWTSHDVVARVRRLTGQRRVGHAGTLDPFATGVLLVCLGQATRVSEYLMDAPKLYRAIIRFGAATDTYDITGTATIEGSRIPSREEIEGLLPRFTGRIEQTPPAYSALKLDGQPAYRRARKGEKVELAPRQVEVYSIDIRSWRPPDLEVDILCGRGIYIRSLAHDLGQAAGSAAHLAALERRAVGSFTIQDAVSVTDLQAEIAAHGLQDLLYPLDEALLQYPALVVAGQDVSRILNGQPVVAEPPTEGALARVYGPDGEFVALARGDAEAGLWRPHKVFAKPCG